MTKVSRIPVSDPPPPPPPPQSAPPGAVPFIIGGGAGSSTVIPILEGGRVRTIVVPPGGFAGFAQQTPATQAMFQRAGRKGGLRSARKRRKTKAKTKRAKTTRRRTTRGKKARLVKGSAAAKRYMASIRRKRKR